MASATSERASLYRAAGADGLFVPGIFDRADIAAVAAALTRAQLPDISELQSWGARRLSGGSDIAESAYRRIAVLARDFLRDGLSAPLSADAMPYPELNALFAQGSQG